MEITCPKCGEVIPIGGLGRKTLNIPIEQIYDAIWDKGSVTLASKELKCSRGYIYKQLAKSIEKPPNTNCALCQKLINGREIAAHHLDYQKNIVIFVCNSCHTRVHSPRKRKKMIDTMLSAK